MTSLPACALLALVCSAHAQAPATTATTTSANSTPAPVSCSFVKPCKKGLMLPAWEPVENIGRGDIAARGIVYLLALCYMFLGVSIVADRFMAAIEVITSQEKVIKVTRPYGEVQFVRVRIWNETVSNLTLMALGSSAPEILLSVIEIVGLSNFEAGELGPSTIVGSAAFNLFVIIGICILVIPSNEVRKIKHLRVFFITATWSIFAYIWLYLIIAVITPNRVDVAEAIVTLLFFPLTVITAYIADKRIFFGRFLAKRAYREGTHKGVVVGMEGDVEMADQNGKDPAVAIKDGEAPDEMREFEQHRQEFIAILRDLRKKHPNMDAKELEAMAEIEAMNKGPKSRAFYRIQATRKLTGAGNVLRKSKVEKKLEEAKVEEDMRQSPHVTRLFFDPGHYTVLENVGRFSLTVARQGGALEHAVLVDFRTEDGSANAGSDYEHTEGTLKFQPGEKFQQFSVSVIDDDVFEEDEHFYVKLSNPRFEDQSLPSVNGGPEMDDTTPRVELATPQMATVMILDDDHAGIFSFEEQKKQVSESCGHVSIKVLRSSGARGRVRVPYNTVEGTAKGGGDDFVDAEGVLVFDNDETEKEIRIRIVDDEVYERSETFSVVLGEPELLKRGSDITWVKKWTSVHRKSILERTKSSASRAEEPEELPYDPNKPESELTEDEKIARLGKPKLGENVTMDIVIKESQEFKSTVDKLLKVGKVSLVVGTSSWREQFIDAVSVNPGDEDDMVGDGENRQQKLPSCSDYVMHFLSLFWKVLFALVPPTDIWNGWACFVVSICMIGLLTAVIGDLASHFGCTIGLKDSITAISFVALGTSVPDTFASKVAAVGDPYADSSIGNVTGSNAVNVFLGIGVAWTIAAVYHAAKGSVFHVPKGALGFSVTIFCIMAVLCFVILIVRRYTCRGELGGEGRRKYISSAVFILFWLTYLVVSSLQAYCYIAGF